MWDLGPWETINKYYNLQWHKIMRLITSKY